MLGSERDAAILSARESVCVRRSCLFRTFRTSTHKHLKEMVRYGEKKRNSSPSLQSPALCLADPSLPSAAVSVDFPPFPAEPEGRERQSVG